MMMYKQLPSLQLKWLPAAFYIFLFSALFFLASNPLQAKENKTYSLHFTCLDYEGDGIDNLCFKQEDESYTPVNIRTLRRSDSYEYKGPPIMQFYKRQIGNTQVPYKNIGELHLNEFMDQENLLLLFFRNNSKEDSYKIYPMPDNQSQFPQGHYRFFNLTENKVLIDFAGKKLEVKPNLFETTLPESIENSNIQVTIFRTVNKKWRRVYSSFWTHEDIVRQLVFITEDQSQSKRKKILLKIIPQVMVQST